MFQDMLLLHIFIELCNKFSDYTMHIVLFQLVIIIITVDVVVLA